MSVYNLSEIPEFARLFESSNSATDAEDNSPINVTNYSTKSNEKYRIVRYNKNLLHKAQIGKYGVFRSVIINHANRVVCFSPPKSIPAEQFLEMYPLPNANEKNENDNEGEKPKVKAIIAQDFVEGTMINVFFDPSVGLTGCWQIATRSTVGANVTFFKGSTKTFNDMFIEACVANGLHIHTLNPHFCYSFVMQHPENRIVVPFSKPQLYLVDVFQIIQGLDNVVKVIPQKMSDVRQFGFWGLTSIRFPETYEFTSYSELIEKFASPNTPYNILGVVVRNLETNERTKFRNPIYEEVRHLRGNQPKMQYQYLCLRQAGKIPEFLKFYPETKNELSGYRDQLHMFTNTLFKNYLSCYVKKEKPLNEFPAQYKTHMFKLHEHYTANLREKKEAITNTYVMSYVNALPPSLLMFCLNHNMRKRNVDTLKADLV
jgi:hypothetical protein